MSSLRQEVISVFRKLHRTRLKTFNGDEYALQVTRDKINEEYRKNKGVKSEDAIRQLNQLAKEVEHEIRTNVIQAVEKKEGVYELQVTEEKLKDNAPFLGSCANLPKEGDNKKSPSKSCKK